MKSPFLTRLLLIFFAFIVGCSQKLPPQYDPGNVDLEQCPAPGLYGQGISANSPEEARSVAKDIVASKLEKKILKNLSTHKLLAEGERVGHGDVEVSHEDAPHVALGLPALLAAGFRHGDGCRLFLVPFLVLDH
jgi:hypothetical protein